MKKMSYFTNLGEADSCCGPDLKKKAKINAPTYFLRIKHQVLML